MAQIETITLGLNAADLVAKINEIIAAVNSIQPTTSYDDLNNKPMINGVELSGNKTTANLSIALSAATDYASLMQTLATKQYADNGDAAAVVAAQSAAAEALSGKLNTDLSNIDASSIREENDVPEVGSLGEEDYITIITSAGARKIKVWRLSDNITVRSVSSTAISKSTSSQLAVIGITGAQNGSNTSFELSSDYVAGSGSLFLNGQRLVSGTDYTETASGFTMLLYAPINTDSLIFIAVPK